MLQGRGQSRGSAARCEPGSRWRRCWSVSGVSRADGHTLGTAVKAKPARAEKYGCSRGKRPDSAQESRSVGQ